MTKTYHIMEKSEWQKHVHTFHPQYGSHYIDLPSGNILVAVTFAHEGAEDHFHESALKDSLPHPVWEGTQKISDTHAAELGHLGLNNSHTVLDVAKAAAKMHPLMRLRSF